MSVTVKKSQVILALADVESREALARTLRLEKVGVQECGTADELLGALEKSPAMVVVFDLSLCTATCGELIHKIRGLAPAARLIVCTPHSEERDASAIEEGVFYYAAGMDAGQLAEAVRAGLRLKGGRR